MITNDAVLTSPAQLQRVIVNFLPAGTRMETLEDRQYTVIPMIMMVEGVHAGSGGPILYQTEELSKTPQVWNHKPIVVYHPEGSACDPVVVENRKVGMMMNTSWDAKGKRLKSEAWLEKNRADKIDNRVFAAVDKNEMMEVSTGLYVDLEQTEGEWNGEEYIGIARNLRADHLALLPDKIGACSIADGAGLMRNSQLVKNSKDPAKLLAHVMKRVQSMLGLAKNEMSYSNVSDALRRAIMERIDPNGNAYVWVCDVYSNFFVYEYDGKLFRLSYSSSDAGATLGSEKPVEVTRVTEYRTVDGAKFVGNEDQPQNADSIMKKAQIIAAILAANCGWSDQKALEGLNDKQLESIHNGVKKEDAADGGADDADENPDGTLKKGKMKKNEAPAGTTTTANAEPAKPATLEDWEKTAPAEVVAAFRSIKNEQEGDRTKLIETITANAALGFTKEDLKTMDLANLRRLAKVAEAPTQNGFQMPQLAPNYSGMAPASPLNADGQPYVEEGLPMPVMNFRKPGKEAAAAA